MQKASKAQNILVASFVFLTMAFALAFQGCSANSTETVNFDGFSIDIPAGWSKESISEDLCSYAPSGFDGKFPRIDIAFMRDKTYDVADENPFKYFLEVFSPKSGYESVDSSTVGKYPIRCGNVVQETDRSKAHIHDIFFYSNDNTVVRIEALFDDETEKAFPLFLKA